MLRKRDRYTQRLKIGERLLAHVASEDVSETHPDGGGHQIPKAGLHHRILLHYTPALLICMYTSVNQWEKKGRLNGSEMYIYSSIVLGITAEYSAVCILRDVRRR